MAATELYTTSLYNDANLVSYWRLEGNSTDSKGSNSGTDTNVTYSAANGKFGQGAGFAGNGKIVKTSPTGVSVNTFSVSAWIKTANGSGGGDVFTNYYRTGDNNGYRCGIDPTNGYPLFVAYKNATPSYKISSAAVDVRDGNWHHIVWVKSGTTYLDIYVDGVRRENDTSDLYDAAFSNVELVIGNRNGDDIPFTGAIDDVAFFNDALTGTEVSKLYSGDFSASPSLSISLSPSISPSLSESRSPSVSGSPSPSLSPSLSPSPSPSLSASLSPSVSESPSPSLSPSASPSAGYSVYTRGDYADLPTNDNDLESTYTETDETNVATKNDVRVAQTGTSQYMIHQFKNFVGSQTSCQVECELQTTLAPSSSTVYLQIYNRNTSAWVTIDSDNTSGADTDFTLIAEVADLTNYKDASNVISCRVYQLST